MDAKSIILLTSHQFNWEWLLTSGCLYLPFKVDFVYQRQSSKLFDNFSLESRSRFGAYPIERSQVARESIRRKNVLRGVAIMADQFPGLDRFGDNSIGMRGVDTNERRASADVVFDHLPGVLVLPRRTIRRRQPDDAARIGQALHRTRVRTCGRDDLAAVEFDICEKAFVALDQAAAEEGRGELHSCRLSASGHPNPVA